jgi:hypothetical protein
MNLATTSLLSLASGAKSRKVKASIEKRLGG